MTNSKLLRETINESGYKLQFVAKKINISYQALLNKLNNATEFKVSEISALCELLKIDSEKREVIFFANFVDLKSTAK